MKVLVLSTNYPSPEASVGLMYIHTRNLYYKQNGIEVEVLNFSSKEDYVWDDINVISLDSYYKKSQNYDVYILHAPNIRNHYLFLKKNLNKMTNIVFFFHGHEVLHRNKVYPKPYSFIKANYIKKMLDNLYDCLKLNIWHRFFPKIVDKSYFVFVSNWMFTQFKIWTKLDEVSLKKRQFITYNGIGNEFEQAEYNVRCNKIYDFITIRSYLDGSKYAVDVVVRLAKRYPEYKFLLVGKGDFFKFYEKPSNLEWIDSYYNHDQIVNALNSAKCALMPTRTDAQGLMACEMASIGMPLITSDIEVCHEIFDSFENVKFINNMNPEKDFVKKFEDLVGGKKYEINKKYYFENTVINEIELLNSIIKN